MAYIALYRKYRPKKFQDVVGQEVVIKILKNSITTNKIGHAYIFSGTRGTGKTSVAKIFSKAINCESPIDGDLCSKCKICKNIDDNCIDIVEIDAASNNGVEEIREIRNNVKLMPTYLKYKVYIIDEVHMLSGSAFNALLKTLEEPPEHVVFILATTEINKIPSTVLSRCQRMDFKKISPKQLEKQLEYILEKEKKTLSIGVIKLVSYFSDGSFRDAINLIDQLITYNKDNITIDDVYDLMGDSPKETIFKLIDCMVAGDIKGGLELINNLYEEGKNFYNISERLQNIIRDIIINNNTHNYFNKEYEEELEKYSSISLNDSVELSNNVFNLTNIMKKSSNQKTLFETYFIKMVLLLKREEEPVHIEIEKKNEDNLVTLEKKEIANEKNEDSRDENFKKVLINNTLATAKKECKKDLVEKYDYLNDYVSNISFNSISNLLLKGIPEVVSENSIIFSFKNNFEVVLFDKNIENIQRILKEIYNIKYEVVAIDINTWSKIKKKYIDDINNGVKYEIIKEDNKKRKNKNSSPLEKEVEDIFGDEIVTVE